MTVLRYGPTNEHVSYVEAEIEEEFGKKDQASVFVRRSVLPESEVQRGVTEMLLVEDTGTADADADFGGILKDINREGSTTEFILESFERYAKDAPPTRGDERFEAANDSTIVNDALSGVSQLSAGAVSTLDNSITMVFSHSSQAKKIREMENATGGEVKYRPDKTVDYVDSLGKDKGNLSGSGTVSQSVVTRLDYQEFTGDIDADLTVSYDSSTQSAGVEIRLKNNGSTVATSSETASQVGSTVTVTALLERDDITFDAIEFEHTGDETASWNYDFTGITLSPANQNITEDFNADKKGGDEDVTHLRVIGAGEGRSQVTVNLVPSADSIDYENDPDYQNVVRYSASHWSSGDRREWDVRSNKDHTSVDALSSVGQSYIDDVQTTHVEAFASVQSRAGIEVNLGDEFTVQYPEEEIDDTLRVIKLTTEIDSTGYTYNADLSTRRVSVEDGGSEERKDLDRYNMAFEGTNVTMTTGGGRQPVNADNNYEFSFYYPDEVNYEHRLQLFVKGFNYRAYSQGAASGGEHTHNFNVNGELEHAHTYNTNGNLEHGHTYNSNNELEHGHTYNSNNELEHGHNYNSNNELEHGHDITSTEFSHSHSISVSNAIAQDHGHNAGDPSTGGLGADSHDHTDGNLGADSHGHPADDASTGGLGADSHDHTDGDLEADGHGHPAGDASFGGLEADSHRHDNNVSITSETINSRDVVNNSSSFTGVIGNTNNSYDDFGTLFNDFEDHESVFVHFIANQADGTIEVRLRGEETGNYYPSDTGIAISGSDNVSGPATGSIFVPRFEDDLDVEVRTNEDIQSNLTAYGQFNEPHTHEVNLDNETVSNSPDVEGDSDDSSPDVGGSTGDDSPDVDGNTGEDSPDVGGSTGNDAPDVNGTTVDTSTGVSGDTDSQGGIRTTDTSLGTQETTDTELGAQETTDTELGTQQTTDTELGVQETTDTELGTQETTEADGDHTHDPQAGIIEFTEYASNCDVLVNGQSVGTSFGDGTGQFEEQVSIAGLLNPGQVNTIEITSDTLGHIMAHLDIDVYRQILGDG